MLACSFTAHRFMLSMPGERFSGPLPVITQEQQDLADELRHDVTVLAARIGGRSTYRPRGLAESALHIKSNLESAGYVVHDHSFVSRGTTVPNLEAILSGTDLAGQAVVVGAHFDTFHGTPGADDNASGVAGTLALARRLAGHPQRRSVRFVFFVNEEPPSFWTPDMGSWVYAKSCRQSGDDIVAMISLESIGYYDPAPKSQRYPVPLSFFFPDRGDFIAVVGNLSSRALTRRAVDVFRSTTEFPCEGASLPAYLPGVGWSDHWSFWQEGYRAIMFTGTATFRNPHYHTPTDTADTLDYERTARVIEGIQRVILHLANEPVTW